MQYWIETEGSGHYFFYAFPLCLLILFILLKGRRLLFLVPSLVITLVIVNPVFYKYWDELGLYAYWRILWIVPVIPIVATVIPALTERIRKRLIKVVISIIGIICCVFAGSFVYGTDRGQFDVSTANATKIPNYVTQIANRLLELKERPRVIVQDPIGVYIRQYSGKIDTLYGRDISGTYIAYPSSNAQKANKALNCGDFNLLSTIMLDEAYDYLILNDYNYESALEEADLELVDRIDEWGIYKAVGMPSKIIVRDELGQIESITTIDEQGNPVNSIDGYATIHQRYNEYGYRILEYYTDSNGRACKNEYGSGGFKKEFSDSGQVIKDQNLGIDGFLEDGEIGCSEVRREYRGNYMIRESYYDSNGFLKNQVGGYAFVEHKYDDEGRIIQRTFFDTNGFETNQNEGFSRIQWKYDDVGGRRLFLFDKDAREIYPEKICYINLSEQSPEGWSLWMKPQPTWNNCTFYIGEAVLNDDGISTITCKCEFEIEFRDVLAMDNQEFRFWTQGTAYGLWDPDLVTLTESPKDGIYTFSISKELTGDVMKKKNILIGFRCDHWTSGAFRVRNVRIQNDT